MRCATFAIVAAFAACGVCQTPPGFEPAVEANLAVIFDAGAVDEPGKSFTIAGRIYLLASILVSNVSHRQKRRNCLQLELLSPSRGLTS